MIIWNFFVYPSTGSSISLSLSEPILIFCVNLISPSSRTAMPRLPVPTNDMTAFFWTRSSLLRISLYMMVFSSGSSRTRTLIPVLSLTRSSMYSIFSASLKAVVATVRIESMPYSAAISLYELRTAHSFSIFAKEILFSVNVSWPRYRGV